jgi:Acyl-CoA dehydrogenase, C-terminal domain
MNFEPNEEQANALSALDRILQPFRTLGPDDLVRPSVYSSRLQGELTDAGFLDIDTDPAGRVTGALVVAELAKLPVCVEATASILVRPGVCPGAAGPMALLWGDPAKPARFLPQARTALLVDERGVRTLTLSDGDVEEVTALFAYPIGQLTQQALRRAADLNVAPVGDTLTWWRLGIALEIFGALEGANQLTVEHVTQRRQFGQPLGALQAIQHRLAMDATTLQATRWLALKAASSASAADAALAAAYAQQAVASIAYDLHQFSGAMGLTLEYPLHLFTYRARLLQSELGGAHTQMATAVTDTWSECAGRPVRRA